MALLQPTAAIYHHPLESATESLKSQLWTGSGLFAAAKLSDGLFPTTGTGTSSTFGSETEFLSASTQGISVISLTATTLVVSYLDKSAAPTKLKSRVGIVSGTSVTFGAFVEVSGDTSSGVASVALSSTKFFIGYDIGAPPNDGKARVGTVTGTAITIGAEVSYGNIVDGGSGLTAARISSTKVVIAFTDSTSDNSKIGTISGTNIVFGSNSPFDTGLPAAQVQLVVLAADKVIVAYRGGSAFGESYVGTVTGTSIAWGTTQLFNAANTRMGGLTRISATQFVIAYMNTTPSNIEAKVGTVSGSSISYATAASFSSGNNGFGVGEIDSSRFVVAYKAGDTTGKSRIGSVSGTTISFGTESTFTSNIPGTDQTGGHPISTDSLNGSVVVAFTDTSDGNHGTLTIGTLSNAASLTGTGASYDSVIGSAKLAYTGWLKNPSA